MSQRSKRKKTRLSLIIDSVKDVSLVRFVKEYYWLYYVAMGVTVVLMLVLVCCEGPRRTFPANIILLGLFTMCQGFMLGTISTYYSVDAILIAVGITSAVAFCLTVFAFQTKIDFTNCGGT